MKNFGLALSGGGYRAAAYHLGTFKKLKELDLLDSIDIISSNSGGSITGAMYVLESDDYSKFYNTMYKGVQSRNVIEGVLTSPRILIPLMGMLIYIGFMLWTLFTDFAWVSLIMLAVLVIVFINFQFKLFPISVFNEKMYNKFFYKGAKLPDFKKKPELIINSTNLETGTLFTFSKNRMWDSSYLYDENGKKLPEVFDPKGFPVARAVAASSCVPFAFSPISIDNKFYYDKSKLKTITPVLVDGGIYDNQGGHKLTYESSDSRCKHVLVSDAGDKMPYEHNFRNAFVLLIRSMDVFMRRIKTLQISQYLYIGPKDNGVSVAYQSLGKDNDECIPKFVESLREGEISEELIKAHGLEELVKEEAWEKIKTKLIKDINYNEIIKAANTPEQLAIARKVGTNLTPLKKNQIDALMRHAYVMTEIQLRLYCPALIK